MNSFDYLLVGGGLQTGLLVLALAANQPSARVAVFEAGPRLGGNHTWSFHELDVPRAASGLIAPLVAASWPGYETRFGASSRVIASPYSTITSERFDSVVRHSIARCGWELRLGVRARDVEQNSVVLETGERFTGRCVIDARGLSQPVGWCGYQKFFGIEVATDEVWPDRLPVLMDGTVEQTDGFHFVYTLPLSSNRVLVEDTYFSDTPILDQSEAWQRIESYLAARVRSWNVIRTESGVLPMPWVEPAPLPGVGPIRGGYAGGWFHPATGYSFPVALRFALAVATVPPTDARRVIDSLAGGYAWRWRFARLLNRLLFRLVDPSARVDVFARLYRTLPPAVLARFYALEFTAADAARIVFGRPPRLDLLRPLRLSGSTRW